MTETTDHTNEFQFANEDNYCCTTATHSVRRHFKCTPAVSTIPLPQNPNSRKSLTRLFQGHEAGIFASAMKIKMSQES